MSDYCITINLWKYLGKIKMDYGIVPVKQKGDVFESEVSEEIFKNLKKSKIGYTNFYKKKDQVYFQTVFVNQSDNTEEAEEKLLPIAENYIRFRIPFRFKFKKFLKERIKRMMEKK